ncbi:hypothetical protein [Streptomyces sp. NPDC058155]|uniref:hypothetical protein n=1 Tax=Streptomyces sp. NPDC058155 TaxID=3346359 RepID=UPI0036EA5103
MQPAQQIISKALSSADGETVSVHLSSGQTIEGTVTTDDEGTATITETGGTVWTVPAAYVTAVGVA